MIILFFSPTSPPGRPDLTPGTTPSPYDQRPGSPYDQRPGSPYATVSYPYATDYPYGRPTTQPPPTPMTTTTPPRPELGYLEVRIDLQRSRFPLNEQVILQSAQSLLCDGNWSRLNLGKSSKITFDFFVTILTTFNVSSNFWGGQVITWNWKGLLTSEMVTS